MWASRMASHRYQSVTATKHYLIADAKKGLASGAATEFILQPSTGKSRKQSLLGQLCTMPRRTEILGVPVSVTDMATAVAEIGRPVDERAGGYVCAADVNSIMQAQRNSAHMEALHGARAVLPDGTPLVWAARLRGNREIKRVPGPDVMLALCAAGIEKGWRHYFYGGEKGVAEDLAVELSRQFPGLEVAGMQSPPFRKLSKAELDSSIAAINAAEPHIVWVGLGCPKQEIWMSENFARLNGAVVIGVGAAFNFHSNRVRRAPAWMRSNGLEWLHRLGSEPQRLWRRYLLLGPEFMVRVAVDSLWRPVGR